MDRPSQRVVEQLRKDCMTLLALASVDDGGDPRVRFVRGCVDEDMTIRCPTFLGTKKVAHIRDHPRVSLTCGHTDSATPGTYFEIQGDANVSTDSEDRRAAWSPQLEKWFSGPEDPLYAVIVIRPARIEALPVGGGPEPEIWERG